MGYPVLLSVCYVPLLLLSPSWVFVVSALATVTYVFATLAGIGDFGMPLGLTAQTFTLLLWRVRAKFAPTVWPNPPSDGQGIAKRVLIAAGIYAAALASYAAALAGSVSASASRTASTA